MALVEDVRKVLNRLAPAGWRQLFLDLTKGELDITSADLEAKLTQQLPFINRDLKGFQDFAVEGHRAIEPGWPPLSLLYHALASPSVVRDAKGKLLSRFPTLAELDTLENYIFSLRGFSKAELKTHRPKLEVVVFSCEYRPALDTVHRKHADFCFSRTGVGRSGTAEPLWDDSRRHFQPLVDKKIFDFRVMPVRYVVYLAAQLKGVQKAFGPMRWQDGDDKRNFWVPVHKLFNGTECIQGLDLHVSLEPHHVHEKLRRLHDVLNQHGYNSGWKVPHIDQPPFVITEGLAEFSRDPDLGPGVLMPVPHPFLIEEAEYLGKPLTFNVLKEFQKESKGLLKMLGSSLWLWPVKNARLAPEFINARHVILPDGREMNLNEIAPLDSHIKGGGYSSRHYIDYTADGWISPHVPQLASYVQRFVSAYSLITPPSFFPYCNQRELMDWATNDFPDLLGHGIWAEPPRVLSDRRYAGNVELKGAGFELEDNTVPAIVSMLYPNPALQRPLLRDEILRPTSLPDGSAGFFDPGWDTTISHKEDRDAIFMENYGLGSPFLEDAKLCAAFGAFWPAVAPDATREFEPMPAWPTVVPLTDEEIGLDGGIPWDGVEGPRIVSRAGKKMVLYSGFDHTDYIDNARKRKITAFLTSKIHAGEYKSRVLTMALVYWAIGIDNAEYLRRYKDHVKALIHIVDAKAQWSVYSFRKILPTEPELKEAARKTSTKLESSPISRFQIYRYGRQTVDPKNPRKRLVEIDQMFTVYVDRQKILLKRDDEAWKVRVIPVWPKVAKRRRRRRPSHTLFRPGLAIVRGGQIPPPNKERS